MEIERVMNSNKTSRSQNGKATARNKSRAWIGFATAGVILLIIGMFLFLGNSNASAASIGYKTKTYADCHLGTSLVSTVPTYRDICDGENLKLYDAMLSIMHEGRLDSNGNTTVLPASFSDCRSLDKTIPRYITYDEPLYTAFSGSAMNKSLIMLSEDESRMFYSTGVSRKEENLDEMYAAIDNEANQIREKALSNAQGSTARFCCEVYRILSEKCEYGNTFDSNHINDIYGALVENKSYCIGQAAAFKYILDKEGIPNFIAQGIYDDAERHAWNVVNIGGEWKLIDVTSSKAIMAQINDTAESSDFIAVLMNKYFAIDGYLSEKYKYDEHTLQLIAMIDVFPS